MTHQGDALSAAGAELVRRRIGRSAMRSPAVRTMHFRAEPVYRCLFPAFTPRPQVFYTCWGRIARRRTVFERSVFPTFSTPVRIPDALHPGGMDTVGSEILVSYQNPRGLVSSDKTLVESKAVESRYRRPCRSRAFIRRCPETARAKPKPGSTKPRLTRECAKSGKKFFVCARCFHRALDRMPVDPAPQHGGLFGGGGLESMPGLGRKASAVG
jgi:hypothetical protein